jgi:hypothetical protein
MNFDLNSVKVYLRIADADKSKDALVNLLMESAAYEIKNFCNITEIPNDLTPILFKVVAFNYNNDKFLDSESQGDMSSTFSKDYPDDMKRQLFKFRKL